jgi:ADP-ribose pyrophosphatase
MPPAADDAPFKPWTVLGRKTCYSHQPFLEVSVESVELPDGRRLDDYHQVAMQEVSVVLAVDPEGSLVCLRQYRHGLRQNCVCLPGGALLPGEPPEQGARRELLEETGFAAEHWRFLGTVRPHANYGCGREHYFLADGLRQVQAPDSGDLEEAAIVHLTRAEVEGMVDRGAAMVTGVLAGFLLYLRHSADRQCP